MDGDRLSFTLLNHKIMKIQDSHIRFRWIGLALIALGAILLSQSQPAQTMWGQAHRVAVLYRVDAEILSKTQAGLHYRTLFWKHNSELIQIYTVNHQDHCDNFTRIVDMFVPGLEALVDERGDTVRINTEQIDAVEAELDWLLSVGSLTFQEDIIKERARWQFSRFIGMTMNEALDYINTHWSPEASW